MARPLIYGGSAIATAVLACGGVGAVLDGADDASLEADRKDATLAQDASPWDHPYIEYPIVDGAGDCAPSSPDGTLATCCSGQPCLGFCVALDDGGVGCSCYGIAGGCEIGRPYALACCPALRGCEVAVDCTWSK